MRRSELEFRKGTILRKEMLDDICRYPRDAADTCYSRFSDGILYGLEWKESGGNGLHTISPGALKYNGQIYFQQEIINVEAELTGQIQIDHTYRLCFVEQKPIQEIESQTIYELQLRAVGSEEYERIADRSFYYARVRCRENDIIEAVDDESGKIYGLFAGDDGYRFKLPDWVVRKELCPLVEKKDVKHPLDYLLLKEAYESKGIAVSFARLYIESYWKECRGEASWPEPDDYSPRELLGDLKTAVQGLKPRYIEGSTTEKKEHIRESEPQGQLP